MSHDFSVLQPQSNLAIFIMLGMMLCFLLYPLAEPASESAEFRWGPSLLDALRSGKLVVPAPIAKLLRMVDWLLVVATLVCFGYLFIQTEPWSVFQLFWGEGLSLGNRAGQETSADFVIGLCLLGLDSFQDNQIH